MAHRQPIETRRPCAAVSCCSGASRVRQKERERESAHYSIIYASLSIYPVEQSRTAELGAFAPSASSAATFATVREERRNRRIVVVIARGEGSGRGGGGGGGARGQYTAIRISVV